MYYCVQQYVKISFALPKDSLIQQMTEKGAFCQQSKNIKAE